MMGSPASEQGRSSIEGPMHLVTLPAPFAVGRYEVTFDEYDVCVQAARCPAVSSAPGAVIYNGIRHRAPDGGWGRGRRPVISVSYADATLYVEWLSEITGESYSVPTESQWEYVARAGTQAQWNTGANLTADDANILSSGFDKTVAVGGYPPNSYGLYDTIGNVWEWTQDCLDTGYVGVPADGSPATQGNCATTGIVRGGSFGSEIDGARSASRFPFGHANRALSVGFRVVRSL